MGVLLKMGNQIQTYNLHCTGNGNLLVNLPENYKYINFMDTGTYAFIVYNSSYAEPSKQLVNVPAMSVCAMPLGLNSSGGVKNQLLIVWNGTGDMYTRIMFSDDPLVTNQQYQSKNGSTSVTIAGDTVGLPKTNQFPTGLSAKGNLKVSIEEQQEQAANNYVNITAATTTAVKTGAGILKGIVIGTTGTGMAVSIYDSTTAAGSKIATITAAAPICYEVNIAVTNGITVVTSGTMGDVTIIYK